MAEEQQEPYYDEGTPSHGEFIPIQPTNDDQPRMPISKEDATKQKQYGHVFDLPLCNLSKRRVLEVKDCFVVLFEKFMTYKVDAIYEHLEPVKSEDVEIVPEDEWKTYKANYRWTRMRKDIKEVAMYYDNEENVYAVTMNFFGVGETTTWNFKKGKEAKAIHDVFQNYLVTRDEKPM